VDGHDLIPHKDGTQSRETQHDIILLADQEEGQDALFPEMGVATAIINNPQLTDVIAVLNRGVGTDDGERQMLCSHGLTYVVGIAFDTRHGLRQEPAVDENLCH
jgi:hypothetical protein